MKVVFENGSQLKAIGGGYWENEEHYGTFLNCTALTSIEIPANVEIIGKSAFKNCSSLITVAFANGSQLKTIEGDYCRNGYYGAFSDCISLTSIRLPANIETIEATAFSGCTNLVSVIFEKGSKLVTIGGGYDTYSDDRGNLIKKYYGAFCELQNLTTIDMSECTQIQSIGEYAFYRDSKLRLFKIGTATPPTCGISAFSDINSYSVLKVPSGCADAYKAKSGWINFASITGLDE